jgi:lambda family phage minor tail protein L
MRSATTNQTNLAATLNAPEVERLFLFELDPPQGGTVYFAAAMEDISYRGNTYVAWPIEHSGIGENLKSEVDTVTLRVGNLTEELSALMELYDGLRNCPVRVLQVVDLSDPQACFIEAYFIDDAKLSIQAAEFTLRSSFSVMEAQIAPRMYSRSFCRWQYKGRGCWRGSAAPWSQPSSWTLGGGADDCKHTLEDCRRHANQMSYGGFPAVPASKVMRT